ncbi:axonemal dynein light chain domain-containing protein 1-like [Periophthalmus magnuspinnatus]|uniref:axonemal dynein light chain domain-containing protein 1-like n=1 Tax=Periophthalmus magnuspinnatus TaxID=409849 RepID=UPI002436BD5D|nr:axonemal dynein light chain domain-containing protein 1-like [Periophthalmus magnuspinnatus]
MSASVRANSAPSSARAERPREGAEVPCRTLVESSKTQLQPVHNEVIPEELLVSLTSTVCSEKRLMPSAHQRHCKGCTFRRPDAVWHHPLGRKKYQYFLEQPTSLGGAGRDISFLCDAAQRKAITLPPLSEKAADTQNMTLSESLIPDEYHIVKNKGLRSLELYEDAFTVQLQDDEQKLRVFPSMKPSGRQEVLQLMRVMDDMLEKAGVEQRSEELNELTQIEGLLELVRTEQNIYNVVFHELIRQVSVACAERGQLLAKLRQRYQSLLERIPQYLKALHTEAVAQRALDRQLTVEIHRIKTSIQQLSRELARIKAHDAFVSQQAERAQHELTEALNQSHNNSEVVQSYHELYELQRSRLNSQLMQMTEERDLWSHLTYCLALKGSSELGAGQRPLAQQTTDRAEMKRDTGDLDSTRRNLHKVFDVQLTGRIQERAFNGQAPEYISEMLVPYTSGRSLRSSGQNLLKVPKTRFKTRGDLSFQAVAPKLWNALPLSLRVADSVDSGPTL